jgi:site-specific recombinase XerD
MRKIKTKLRIEKKVTTYVARHTFSTVLKRSGVSTEFIEESLGHQTSEQLKIIWTALKRMSKESLPVS